MPNQTPCASLHKRLLLSVLAAVTLAACQQSLSADTIQITGNAVNGFGNLNGDDTEVDFTLTINISGLPVPPSQPLETTEVVGTLLGFQATNNAVNLSGESALPIPSDSAGSVQITNFADGAELDFQVLSSTGNVDVYGYLELPNNWIGTTPILADNCCESSELYTNLVFPGDSLDSGSYLFYVNGGQSRILSTATPEPDMFGPAVLVTAIGLAVTVRRRLSVSRTACAKRQTAKAQLPYCER